jgi:hypothetical protein
MAQAFPLLLKSQELTPGDLKVSQYELSAVQVR